MPKNGPCNYNSTTSAVYSIDTFESLAAAQLADGIESPRSYNVVAFVHSNSYSELKTCLNEPIDKFTTS